MWRGPHVAGTLEHTPINTELNAKGIPENPDP